jgi:hypothetical protein
MTVRTKSAMMKIRTENSHRIAMAEMGKKTGN